VVKEPGQFACSADENCPERACATRSGLAWTLAVHKDLLRIRPSGSLHEGGPLPPEPLGAEAARLLEGLGWREKGAQQTSLRVGDVLVFSSQGDSGWTRWATADSARKGVVDDLPTIGFEPTTRSGGLLFLGRRGLSETVGEVHFVEDVGRRGLGSYRIARLGARPVAWSRRATGRWLVLTDRALLDLDPASRSVSTVVDLTSLAPRVMLARDDAVYLGMRYFVVEVRGDRPPHAVTWYVRKGCPTRLGSAETCLPCNDPP
jgi:hypothetical protein